ncbi:hypothetical protein CYLTODRAFT_182495 [Cylindrobasidium torrendii FP15055 ss-10]|uniref:Helicase C-terminal domain-containing protein n=1 Tax=Cylindrobasidium torrendii FP15055 ss-10 TaxID=1314674 RepID=A0A0D7AWS2_9AGAR|nr:hypothetical protein CYLTODRAFT_182495 [Cylindrobasidium torrendii FP15055 ss-10]
MSFGTGSNDEVHVGRGETTTTDSFDALWALTLVKSGLTGTPLMQGANDLRSMARLCRPPIFTELEMMSFNSQEQDLKRLKRQYGIKLEDVAANPTKMNELTKSVAGSVSMVHSKIMVAQARKYIIPYTLRVTKHTKNNEGKLVTQGLPDNTSLIVGMEVSQEEFHAADTEFHKSHAGESTKSKNTGLEGMSASRFGTFFAAGRKVLNAGLFLGLQESSYIPTSQEDFIRLRATKMRTLLDVVHGMVTKEPGNAIPATREVVDKDGNTHTEPLHGSQHCIVDLTELGLIPAHTEQWVPPPTVSFAEMKKAGKRIPKVVVYLAMAQYHPAVVAMFNMWGIKAISMSGAFAPARRATIQKEWEAKEDLSVLIISDAGTQGLNLVAADGMVLQDIPWSENEVIQIIARLWRHGQKRPTFVVRLMVKGTVEHMMVANGTAKRDMLEKFLDGKASPRTFRRWAVDFC